MFVQVYLLNFLIFKTISLGELPFDSPLFEGAHFLETATVPLIFRKTSIEKSYYQFRRKLYPDDACPQAQDVHVVVLYALVRRVCIMAKAGSYTWYLVGYDACPPHRYRRLIYHARLYPKL